ncbi:MAG: NADH-quinone oxidoreductase subunit C [Thermodesulfobacteriota bacterium]
MSTKLAEVKAALEKTSPRSLIETDYKAKGFHLDAAFTADRLVEAVTLLDGLGFFIETITGVDHLGFMPAKADGNKPDARDLWYEHVMAPDVRPDERHEPEEAPGQYLEAVYDFNRFDEPCRVVIRVRTPRANPVIPTISHIFQAAHWHERETHDFFGIKFEGHPYLVPLLLPEDADFHPLLKDYKP